MEGSMKTSLIPRSHPQASCGLGMRLQEDQNSPLSCTHIPATASQHPHNSKIKASLICTVIKIIAQYNGRVHMD